LKQNFELVRFKIVPADFTIANSAPIVNNFVGEIQIYANESKEVTIGELSDSENTSAFTIKKMKAKCEENESTWINSEKSTDFKIILVLRVPSDIISETCTFEFTVYDNDLKAPISLTKTVKIIVKAQKFKGVKTILDVTPIKIKAPEVKESAITSAGAISLIFDQYLVFPNNFYELTS